jgi:hypothetical protein
VFLFVAEFLLLQPAALVLQLHAITPALIEPNSLSVEKCPPCM